MYLMPLVTSNCLKDGFRYVEGLFIPMFQQTVLGAALSGRLMVFMPQKLHLTLAQWELSFAPDCNSDLHLFSLAEYIPFMIIVIPVMRTSLNIEISR